MTARPRTRFGTRGSQPRCAPTPSASPQNRPAAPIAVADLTHEDGLAAVDWPARLDLILDATAPRAAHLVAASH